MACEVVYKGEKYQFEEFVQMLHDGLLDKFIDDGSITNIEQLKNIGAEIKQEVKPVSETKQEVSPEVTTKDLEEETEMLIEGLAEERRKKGKFTQDGNTFVRNEKIENVPTGIDGEVRFTSEPGGGGIVVPFKYKLVEAEILQPSHQGGLRNPNFFIPEAQPKNRNDQGSLQAEDSFAYRPRFGELGADTNAYGGAPVVNQRGEVIQGNNRVAGLKKGYALGTALYKAALEKNAAQFGFTPEQVYQMKNPVLVREIAVNDAQAIEYGNYDVKDLETSGKRRIDPVALVRRMPTKVRESLAKLVASGESINETIRNNQTEIYDLLKPYLNQSQKTTMLKNGKFTEEGIEDIESVFQQFLFQNGDSDIATAFESLSNTQREGLKKSLPYLLSAGREKSIIPDVQEAIIALYSFNASRAQNFGTWLGQSNVFNDGKTPADEFSPLAIKIASIINDAKTQGDIVGLPSTRNSLEPSNFVKYADLATDKEAGLFDEGRKGLSRKEAVKEAFGVDYTERKSYSSIKDIEQTAKQAKEKEEFDTEKQKAKEERKDLKKKIASAQGDIEKSRTKLGDFLRENLTTKPVVFKDKNGNPINITKSGFDWNEMVNAVADLIDEGYEVAMAVKVYLQKQGWFNALPQETQDAVEEQAVDHIESVIASKNEGPELIGITNAYDNAQRMARGLDPVAKAARKSNVASWDEAMAIIRANGKDYARNEVEKMATEKDFVEISPIKQAIVLYDRIRITNERESLEKDLSSPDTTIQDKAAAVQRLAELEIEQEANEQANKNIGRTWGRTGIFRQALAARDYSIRGIIARAKAVTGDNLSAKDQIELEQLGKALDTLQKQYDEITENLSNIIAKERRLAAKEAYDKAKKELGLAGGQSSGQSLKQKGSELASKIRALKIKANQGYTFGSAIPIPPTVINVGIEAAALAAEKGGVIADHIQSGIQAIRDEAKDWYDKLSENEKERFDRWFGNFVKSELAGKPIKNTSDLLTDLAIKADGTLDESLRPILNDIIRSEIINGAENLDQIVDTVYDFLKDTIEGLDKEELKDLMSGYGKFKELNKDEINQKVREVKKIGRLEAALRDVTEKLQLPKRTGIERDQLSDKARNLQRDILKAIKELGIEPEITEEDMANQWRSARDAVKRGIENSIADVQSEIDKKEKIKPAEKRKFDDEELKDLRDRLKALKDIRDAIPEIKESEDERKLAKAIKEKKEAIAELKRKIINNDLSKKQMTRLENQELKELSEELDRLNKKLNKMREAAKTEDQKIAESIKRVNDAAAREIARLTELRNNIIAQGLSISDKVTETNEPGIGKIFKVSKDKLKSKTQKADALASQIKELKRQISDLIPEEVKKQAILNKALKQREKVLSNLEEKLQSGNFEKPAPKLKPYNAEIAKVEREISKKRQEIDYKMEQLRLKNLHWLDRLKEGFMDAVQLPKSLVASVDLSAPLRQGISFLPSQPRLWGKAFAKMFQFAFSQNAYDNWLSDVQSDPRYNEFTERYKLFISDQTGKMSAREERFISKALNLIKTKVPIYGQLLAGSERAYVGFINKLRWDVFNQFVNEVESLPLTQEEKDRELKELASLVNNATGRGKLGKLEAISPALNVAFFSPKLIASRLHPFAVASRIINPATNKEYPAYARKQAIKTYLTFLGGGMLAMALISLMLDDDDDEKVELDPRSSDFMKLKIGDVRYDFFGGYLQAIVAISKLLGGIKSTTTGEVKKFGDAGFGEQTRKDVVENYFENKLAPVPSILYKSTFENGKIMERNPIYEDIFGEIRGYDMNLGEESFNLTNPLYFKDVYEAAKEADSQVLGVGLASLFGAGVNRFGGVRLIDKSSPGFSVQKDIYITPPRTESKKEVYNFVAVKKGENVIVEYDRKSKAPLTTSELKKYNKEVGKAYEKLLAAADADFVKNATPEQKKELGEIILAKARMIAELRFSAKGNDAVGQAANNLENIATSILNAGKVYGKVEVMNDAMLNYVTPSEVGVQTKKNE